jgi:hypothetical protein
LCSLHQPCNFVVPVSSTGKIYNVVGLFPGIGLESHYELMCRNRKGTYAARLRLKL